MNTFEPSASRARECRAAMDCLLWDSARDLLAEIGCVASVESAGSQAASEPTDFLDFGAYFDLAMKADVPGGVTDDDHAAAVAHLQRRLANLPDPDVEPSWPRITSIGAADYTSAETARMRRWWDVEDTNRMAMIPPSEEEAARFPATFERAMSELSQTAPEMYGEILAIERDIVLTKPDGINNRINYSGGSSFALWGAMTVNAETQVDWTQVYRQIVHETGHSLLFGIARDNPVIASDPALRRPSPIRTDPRPVDGVFHAAFVSAREALALDELLIRHERTDCLDEGDAPILEDLLDNSVVAFWQCIDGLRGGVELTDFGDTVLADCEAYMSANFAIEAL